MSNPTRSVGSWAERATAARISTGVTSGMPCRRPAWLLPTIPLQDGVAVRAILPRPERRGLPRSHGSLLTEKILVLYLGATLSIG